MPKSKSEARRLDVQVSKLVITIEISKETMVAWYGKDIPVEKMKELVSHEFSAAMSDTFRTLGLERDAK